MDPYSSPTRTTKKKQIKEKKENEQKNLGQGQ